MARRTGFREQYYTGTRRSECVKEDCRQNQGETNYVFVTVFHQFLRIDQFVWALVLCGIRYYQNASWDSSWVGDQENPYEKDWATSRSVHLMEIWHNSWLEDVRHAKMDLSGPRETRQCSVKLASSSGSPRGNKGWRFTAGFKYDLSLLQMMYLWLI